MDDQDLIVVVDDDVDIARFVEVNLTLEGFAVILAYDGMEALHIVEERNPDLAIIDWMMPGLDGMELVRRLRANPLKTSMPIIMLTARGQAAEKVMGLTAGVDDYLVKPFDTMELIARVRSTLRRNQEYREVSPLTGLPGNNRILREISDRIRAKSDYAVCYIDIDRFKSVNDVYGFARGDEFITALARTLYQAIIHMGPPPIFLGHVGGDDFTFVCHPSQVSALTEKIIIDFEAAADSLYDPIDATRGYLELVKRTGEIQRANLVTLSIGVTVSIDQRFSNPREAVAAASEMKTVAKGHNGSYVAFDCRGVIDSPYRKAV